MGGETRFLCCVTLFTERYPPTEREGAATGEVFSRLHDLPGRLWGNEIRTDPRWDRNPRRPSRHWGGTGTCQDSVVSSTDPPHLSLPLPPSYLPGVAVHRTGGRPTDTRRDSWVVHGWVKSILPYPGRRLAPSTLRPHPAPPALPCPTPVSDDRRKDGPTESPNPGRRDRGCDRGGRRP